MKVHVDSASALPAAVLASPGAGPSSPSAALVDKVRLMEQTCSALNSKLAEMADSEAALEQTAALTQRSVGLLLDEDEVRAVGIANPSTRPHPSHPHPSHPNPCPSPNPLEESKVRVRVRYP